ncbi:hypothetical protein BC351_40460 [Paenibacillus ferrarius]|uniref:UvrABC system protein A n=1 Tax=Paenibacillus ferrarius TaxID=1469647 RepID=A0A1V4H753_9BACL|nr:hypothetical protein [Paenibacillus ferrarius]OPH47029.1 hypothetical protein BC351_40460 [Paenibacillus ferrarius]
MNKIEVFNARIHNLNHINIEIPKYKFIVVTGVSGSGKSSFIFDTLHKEGQRLYLEAMGISHGIFNYDEFDLIQGSEGLISIPIRSK